MVNQSDIAKALQVDPACITRWARRGMPVHDIAAARRWRSENIRPRAKPMPRPDDAPASASASVPTQQQTTEQGGSPYWTARTEREQAEAEKAKLEVLKMRGDLVERQRVERASYEAGRLLRDMVLAVPSKVAPEVLALQSAQEVEAKMRDELRRVLAELSRLSRTGLEAA